MGSSADVDLCIPDRRVSGYHASLELFVGGRVYLKDEGSTNGTFLEGIRLERGAREPLKDGDLISLSPWVQFRVRIRARRPRHSSPRISSGRVGPTVKR